MTTRTTRLARLQCSARYEVSLEDRPNFIGFQVPGTLQRGLGHPVQHRVVPDAGEVIDIQLLKRVECPAARKARVHPDQHADAGKCFEESVRRLQREIMGLLRTILPGLAKPRSENVAALTANRHHRVIALMTDISVVATAGLFAVNQERNIVDVDRHPVRDPGGAEVGAERLTEPADSVLQDPLTKNRKVLLAAQHAEEAGKRRLRGQVAFIRDAAHISRRSPQARIAPQAVRIVLIRMALGNQEQERPQKAANRMRDRARPTIINQMLLKPSNKSDPLHQLPHWQCARIGAPALVNGFDVDGSIETERTGAKIGTTHGIVLRSKRPMLNRNIGQRASVTSADAASRFMNNPGYSGGAGADTFIFSCHGSGTGNDTITDFTSGEDTIDLRGFPDVSGFDDLTLTQDGDDVVIDLTAHGGGTIRLESVSLDDITGESFIFQIDGTEDDDSIQGSAFREYIYGGGGNDTLDGGGGDDVLFGGDGNDALRGGAGADEVSGGSGSNTLDGGASDDYFV